MESATFLKEEFIEMTFDLEEKSMYISKGTGMTQILLQNIQSFVQLLNLFYELFQAHIWWNPSLAFIKQTENHFEHRDDLWLKLTNL